MPGDGKPRRATVLLDTHVLIWLATDPERIRAQVRDKIARSDALFVSAVTAFELDDLARRRRIPEVLTYDAVSSAFLLTTLDLPHDVWRIAASLDFIHGDPVDRMLIAHAIHADLTLVTADENMRRYPVRSLW